MADKVRTTGYTQTKADDPTRWNRSDVLSHANAINELIDRPEAIPKSIVDSKGDLLVGSADNNLVRLAIGSSGQVLTIDNTQPGGVKWATPAAASSGGSGGSAPTYDKDIGDGTIGPFTVAHGLGTRNVDPIFRENIGSNTGRRVDIDFTATPNSIRVEPAIAIALDGIHVHLEARPGTDDVTPPTGMTLTYVSKTSSTVTFTPSATDSVGVVAYDWFRGGTYVGTSYGTANYTYTGLTAGTTYPAGTFSAIAYDRAGNGSASGSYGTAVTTNASPNVARTATGQGRSVNATTVSWTINVPSGANTVLLAYVLDSHSAWFEGSTVTTRTVTSDRDGALTEIAAVDSGPNGQPVGTLRTFVLGSASAPKRPTPGTHTLTATVSKDGYTPSSLCARTVSYDNVGAIVDVVSNRSTAADTVNQSLASAVGDYNIQAVSYDAAAPTGGNRTQVGTAIGGSVDGLGDYLFVQDAPGTASAQVFTTSGAQWHAETGKRLKKAV